MNLASSPLARRLADCSNVRASQTNAEFWAQRRAEEGFSGSIRADLFSRVLRVASVDAHQHARALDGQEGGLCGQRGLAGIRGVCSGPDWLVDCPACKLVMALKSLVFF